VSGAAALLAWTLACTGTPVSLALQQEIVAAIQVHGNTLTPDDEIRRLAGVEIGSPATPTLVDEVTARLRAAKKFDSVQVLKRFASISDPTQVLLVIVVDEGAVHVESTGDPANPTRVVRARRLGLMFLPILYREDGYGFTYGVRFARPNVAGRNSRLSFPLTWGGEKQAGIELDKTLENLPIDRVIVGGSVTRRTNLFFKQDDDRLQGSVRVERQLASALRAGGTAGAQRVSFLDSHDAFGHVGGDLVFDNRVDPMLARRAVYARAAWDHYSFGADQTQLDVRGYIGLPGQNVLTLRGVRWFADSPLPFYLKPLLGGLRNVRGYAAGTDAGDNLAAASAEVIVPLTSPLDVGKVGVSAFIDVGAAYDYGERLADQTLKQGIGGSVWFSAAFVKVNVAVAHGRGSSTRVHVGASVSF